MAVLEDFGLADIVVDTDPVALPLLFLYGRSDLSIDYFGATVTPDSVREILYSIGELAPSLESFRLVSREDERHNTTLEVALEIAGGFDPALLDPNEIGRNLFARLADINCDFRNAYFNTATGGQLPFVSLHHRGTGPFGGADRIKNQYVSTGPDYDRV